VMSKDRRVRGWKVNDIERDVRSAIREDKNITKIALLKLNQSPR